MLIKFEFIIVELINVVLNISILIIDIFVIPFKFIRLKLIKVELNIFI